MSIGVQIVLVWVLGSIPAAVLMGKCIRTELDVSPTTSDSDILESVIVGAAVALMAYVLMVAIGGAIVRAL